MTNAIALLMRCRICGYKSYFYFREQEAYHYQYNIFSPYPCEECKPQKRLDNYVQN